MNLNKVFLIGNITKDPELKKTPNGSSVAGFSLATNRNWVDKNSGERHEQAEFHNIVVFGKMAETICQYTKRGSQILVEGRLQTRTWEKDGKKNYRTEIVLEEFQFGNKKEAGTPAPQPAAKPSGSQEPPDLGDGDIPF